MKWSRLDGTTWTRLQKALFVSVVIHGALLSLRIAAPERFDRLFSDSPLEVILVNTRAHATRPQKVQALAQAQLAGGGDAQSGHTTSPVPTANMSAQGEIAESLQNQLAAMRRQQSVLLTQVKKLVAQMPVMQPNETKEAQKEVEKKRSQLLKLLAEIEERINQENEHPRKHYLSPATKEVAYALYYDSLRRKIEDRGTRYFPENQNGEKLYGQLTLMITIDSQGRVVSTQAIQRSSSNAHLTELERHAQAIVMHASPFGNFTAAMRQQADQLVVVSRFIFSRDNTLHTRSNETPP